MLTINKDIKVFDTELIHKGDCIRVKYKDDIAYKNGFVIQVNESRLQILYCNQSGNATNFLFIPAVEVAAGLWEIFWTRDFVTMFNEGIRTDV